MKKIIRNILLAGFVICFISCKKNTVKMVSIEVVEYNTNIPIPGTTIHFINRVILIISAFAGILKFSSLGVSKN